MIGGLELVSPILVPSPAEIWVTELQTIFSVCILASTPVPSSTPQPIRLRYSKDIPFLPVEYGLKTL